MPPLTASTPVANPRPFDLAAWQSRQARLLGIVVLVLVGAFGAAMAAWIHARGVIADGGWTAAFCAMPALAVAALLCTSMQDARQALLRFLVALMFGPILLLFWAASLDAPVPAAAHARGLDVAQVQAGAAAVQSIGTNGGDVVLMRAASFADGTELRLTRLIDAEAARQHLAFLAQGLQGRDASLGGRPGMRIDVAGGWVIHTERHGGDLLEVRGRDEASALSRLAAQGIPMPDTSQAPAAPEAPAVWPVATAAAVALALTIVVFLLWAAARTTQVPPVNGAKAIDEARLRTRLASLPTAGVHCRVTPDSPGMLRVALPTEADRHHEVLLTLDAPNHCVRVIERLGASGAAPADADEADMRMRGDEVPALNPPDAQLVWSRMRQATMIRPAQYAALAPRFDEDDALRPTHRNANLDAEGMVTLLCAVVTASGWRWRPALF